MAIILGANSVSKLYKGSQEISKLYLGGALIFASSNYPNWYKDGWQELLQPDTWDYPLCVTVACATTPSSGNVPNCTIMRCSFIDYYSYTSTPAQVMQQSQTASLASVRATRSNDTKKKQYVIYDAVTNTWGTVTTEISSGFASVGNVMLTQSVPAFIYSKRIPTGYPDITTNLPYIE